MVLENNFISSFRNPNTEKDKLFCENKTVLSGHQDNNTKLWKVPINNNDQHTCNLLVTTEGETNTHFIHNVYEKITTAELIQYLHAAAFSPTTTTWNKAINLGWFTSRPALTADQVLEHYIKKSETAMGHQHTI